MNERGCDPTEVSQLLADRIRQVRESVNEASRRAGRPAQAVKLIAVTKTVSAEMLRQAAELGLDEFGENRVQEAALKRPWLSDLPLRWRLIGNLQKNKARRALELFDAIDSLDDVALAQRLDALCAEAQRRLPVLIEVNIAAEPQKHGVPPGDLPRVAEAVLRLPHLDLQGLMTVPPQSEVAEVARPWFAALRQLGERLGTETGLKQVQLSMGMSHDYPVAIEEGATMVRVGSAIFGARR